MNSDPRILTAPRMITSKLSFKRLSFLKLSAIFSEEKASTMSQDNQVATKESSNLVSRAKNTSKYA